jgi:hypothetical protein
MYEYSQRFNPLGQVAAQSTRTKYYKNKKNAGPLKCVLEELRNSREIWRIVFCT